MKAGTIDQLEKNVSLSFTYVRKDLLMLNDAISDLNDKIQHISLNHAALLEKIESIEKKRVIKPKKESPKKKSDKEVIEFYDLKAKKKFKTNEYVLKTKSGRRFAVADSPSGIKSWRILGVDKNAKSTKTKATKVKKTVSKKTNIVKTKETTAKPKKIIKETIEY